NGRHRAGRVWGRLRALAAGQPPSGPRRGARRSGHGPLGYLSSGAGARIRLPGGQAVHRRLSAAFGAAAWSGRRVDARRARQRRRAGRRDRARDCRGSSRNHRHARVAPQAGGAEQPMRVGCVITSESKDRPLGPERPRVRIATTVFLVLLALTLLPAVVFAEPNDGLVSGTLLNK